MSSDQQHREDDAIWTALEALETTVQGSSSERADQDLRIREYKELLGLVAYSLEPAAPRPELRRDLLERIAAGAGPKPVGAAENLVAFPQRSTPEASATRAPANDRIPWRSAVLPVAAVLAVCLLAAGYFLGKSQEQQATIAFLKAERDVAVTRSAQARVAELEMRLGELRRVKDDYDMITRVARQVYPIRGASARPGGRSRDLEGNVFVCGQHQRWLVDLRGLEPAPAGHEYHFWFITDDGRKINGGPLELHGDEARLRAPAMPAGTRGFAVTLETASGEHLEPEGELLLVAEEAISL